MALTEDYVRVDITKVLDAADALEALLKDLRDELDAARAAVDRFDRSEVWYGEAATSWHKRFDKAFARVQADIEKYESYPAFLRDRAQVYLLHAADAQALADNLDSEVTKLVSSLLEQSGASLREVQDAAKRRREGEGN